MTSGRRSIVTIGESSIQKFASLFERADVRGPVTGRCAAVDRPSTPLRSEMKVEFVTKTGRLIESIESGDSTTDERALRVDRTLSTSLSP